MPTFTVHAPPPRKNRSAADPERFRLGYDDLLSATGLGEASELAARFGIDVRSIDFWTASLDVLRGRIDEFCALASDETSSPT